MPVLFRNALTVPAFLILYTPIIFVLTRGIIDLHAWQLLFQNGSLLGALKNSVCLAMGVSFLSILISITMIWSFRGSKVFESVFGVMTVLPEVVQGLGLLIWFSFLKMTLGWDTIVLAHLAFCTPFVFLNLIAAYREIPESLFEAAQDLGANEKQVFFKVCIPELKGAILVSAILAFTISLDDFLISFFVSGGGQSLLPVKVYSLLRFGIHPELGALSAFLMGLTTIGVLLGLMLKISGPKRLKKARL